MEPKRIFKWVVFLVFLVLLAGVFSSLNFGKRKMLSPGGDCRLNEDCVSGNCNFDGNSMVCCESGVDCCANELGCSSEKICFGNSFGQGVCKLKGSAGDKCFLNSDCVVENCQNGLCCALGETCCFDDNECEGSGKCDGEKHYCISLKAVGISCNSNAECLSGNCAGGMCCANGMECCDSDADCNAGQSCNSFYGYCV